VLVYPLASVLGLKSVLAFPLSSVLGLMSVLASESAIGLAMTLAVVKTPRLTVPRLAPSQALSGIVP
jgi:hypothetical protein